MSFPSSATPSLSPRTPCCTASRGPAGCPEFVVTEAPGPGESAQDVFRRLRNQLDLRHGELLALMIYSRISCAPEISRALNDVFGPADWPVTWMEGDSCGGDGFGGVQAFAVTGRPVARIPGGDGIAATVYQDLGARHCFVGGLYPDYLLSSRPEQVEQVFNRLQGTLALAGFSLGDVFRTWFYNEDILRWYDVFNQVRTAHYRDVRWRAGAVPASTGIGARNPAGSCLTLAARAFQPLDNRATVRAIPSPLQCPALAYGSSFSRAMELDCAGWRYLTVSGTASIAPDGTSAHRGDIERQIHLTLDVIQAILRARGMRFTDAIRATAYFKEKAFQLTFDRWCTRHGLETMPVVCTHNDVCRDDLLFELELDACISSLPTGTIADSLRKDQ